MEKTIEYLEELRDGYQFKRNTCCKGDPAIIDFQIKANEINSEINRLEENNHD